MNDYFKQREFQNYLHNISPDHTTEQNIQIMKHKICWNKADSP